MSSPSDIAKAEQLLQDAAKLMDQAKRLGVQAYERRQQAKAIDDEADGIVRDGRQLIERAEAMINQAAQLAGTSVPEPYPLPN